MERSLGPWLEDPTKVLVPEGISRVLPPPIEVPETWEQPPHTSIHSSPMAIITPRALASPAPGEDSESCQHWSEARTCLHLKEEQSPKPQVPSVTPWLRVTHRKPRPHLHPLEKETGRWQYKNTFDNKKSNMKQLENSGSTSSRHEHPNAEKAEENDLKK